MPINPNALGAPQPDPQADVAPGLSETEAAEQQAADEQPKQRKRRTKAELIADAVVPADDAPIEIKDAGTGAKVQRPWAEAAALVKAEQAEFVDKGLKYALLKYEQQGEQSAFEQPPSAEQITAVEQAKDDAPAGSVPPEAALGDEVVVGVDVYRVGNGGVLTSSPIADSDGNIVKPKRRWQRELGSGLNGPWESRVLTQTSDPRPVFDKASPAPEAASNGHPDVTVETVRQPHEIEEIAPGAFKVGTGILEKIGLPDYSSMQVGPLTMSRIVHDDGRRSTVMAGSREVEVVTAAVEMFDLMDDTIEYIARQFRGHLISFLEATGALKQPVS